MNPSTDGTRTQKLKTHSSNLLKGGPIDGTTHASVGPPMRFSYVW